MNPLRTRLTIGIIAVTLLSCGRKPPTAPTSTLIVTISAAGLTPASIDAAVGSRVQFVNNDSRSHYMHSDPHPDATDCPELNQVGVLAPGQRRETGNLVIAGTCGYHDHDMPSNNAFQGRIVVR